PTRTVPRRPGTIRCDNPGSYSWVSLLLDVTTIGYQPNRQVVTSQRIGIVSAKGWVLPGDGGAANPTTGGGIVQAIRPSSRARATACVLLVTPSLLYASLIYHLTVPRARISRSAISRLDNPSATSASTSSSRSVSGLSISSVAG